MDLLDDKALERSSIVANCLMNRERSLEGSNGYAKELRFHPLDFLRERTAAKGSASWLDLCCGTGKALLEAAAAIRSEPVADRIEIVGVDLVRSWSATAAEQRGLRLIEASLADWDTAWAFDLITCVHGLHYIGDKLGLIARATTWLSSNGRFVANLDLDNLKIEGLPAARGTLARALRQNGIDYDRRRKLVACSRRTSNPMPFRYLGADDRAGPNCTGQSAVNSHYIKAETGS